MAKDELYIRGRPASQYFSTSGASGNKPREPKAPKKILPTGELPYVPPHKRNEGKTTKNYSNPTRKANFKAT